MCADTGANAVYVASAQLLYASDRVTAPLDLISRRVEGAYVESTPSYPNYYHGNRLVLDKPPQVREIDTWIARYHELFAWRTEPAPAIITWYTEGGETPSLGRLDILIENATALRAPELVKGTDARTDLHFVEIKGDDAWEELAQLECAAHPEYGTFNRWRVGSFRSLVAAGRGSHYALRAASGEMVAAAGGYAHAGVARYASVLTARAYRRRGYACYLVAAILALLRDCAAEVLIVADEGSSAERVYRAAGFETLLRVHSLVVPP